MVIRWLGQASFHITTAQGKAVRMDPFDESLGLPVLKEPADVVTVSHGHFDHNAVHLVGGKPVVVDRPGTHEAAGMTFTGLSVFHDDTGGSKRGKNVIFRFEADGVAVCHLGDLGHGLSPEQVKGLGRVDVLLVPVGGFYTIDARQADAVVRQLQPRVTVPMHYKLGDRETPITDEKPFLEGKTNVRRLNRLEVTGQTLPARPEIVVLSVPA